MFAANVDASSESKSASVVVFPEDSVAQTSGQVQEAAKLERLEAEFGGVVKRGGEMPKMFHETTITTALNNDKGKEEL